VESAGQRVAKEFITEIMTNILENVAQWIGQCFYSSAI
jgi:hypothetical protein